MIRRLTSKLRSVLLQGRVRRAVAGSNPFSTHLPILTGLGVLFPIHRVLELGGGLYSTAAFLDRATFPALEALDRTIRRHARSVEAEDVAQWRQIFRADPRLAWRSPH